MLLDSNFRGLPTYRRLNQFENPRVFVGHGKPGQLSCGLVVINRKLALGIEGTLGGLFVEIAAQIEFGFCHETGCLCRQTIFHLEVINDSGLNSVLFRHIEELQGSRPWGRFLDAGTGWASLRWALSLTVDELVAVTGSRERLEGMKSDFGSRLDFSHRLLHGNWVQPDFLSGERFETILVDYLVGAVDRFAPYFQTRLFSRLREHAAGRLYVIGLEPHPPSRGDSDRELLEQLCALRDASLLLSGDRPNREYPRWWVVEQLEASGFKVTSQTSFPIHYGQDFVEAELEVCRGRIDRLPATLRGSFKKTEADLRETLLKRVKRKPIQWGVDYVLSVEVP